MFETYVVKSGDTIESIASEYGVRIDKLVSVNNLEKTYFLTPGQEILIPIDAPNGLDYYKVQPGDNLYSIAGQYNTTADFIATVNGLDLEEYIYPDEMLLVPTEGYKVYITKDGDTFKFVADAFGVNENALIRDNENIYLLSGQLMVTGEKQN